MKGGYLSMQDDNFNGENNEYDAAPETPLPPTPSEAPETPVATPNVYDSPPEPPVFTGRADDAQPVPPSYTSHINMQVNERKKRRWLPITIGAIVLLYIILTAVLIGMVVHFARNGGLQIQRNDGHLEIAAGDKANGNDEKINEHLKIQPPPSVSGGASANGRLSIKEVAKKVRTSVVGVISEGGADFSSSGVGSGIIMSADGYIITNNHVVEGMSKISVVTDAGKNYPAKVIGTDSRTDLAVLKITATGLPVAVFGNSDKLEQGDVAVAIGNPAGIQLQNTVTSGIISAINRDIIIEDREMTLIQTDASINPGNSGGPLVNEFGQVIGINTVKIGISYYEGLGFAIPINTVKPIVDERISRGYIKGRPSIGINGSSISERDAQYMGLVPGMYIEYVHPNSDAFKKGLQRGDIITKMNGTPLTSREEVKKVRDKFKAGDTVKLTVFRNGQTKDFNIILMDEAVLNKIGSPKNGVPN
ncbi:MAG: trypsin-like peptidase domain-containing protein [Clostridia bacterium]